jgi:hypothetical protein
MGMAPDYGLEDVMGIWSYCMLESVMGMAKSCVVEDLTGGL